jgi:hypothetical protein
MRHYLILFLLKIPKQCLCLRNRHSAVRKSRNVISSRRLLRTLRNKQYYHLTDLIFRVTVSLFRNILWIEKI